MKFSVDIGGYIIVLGLGVGIVFLVMKMIKYQILLMKRSCYRNVWLDFQGKRIWFSM